MTHKFSHLSNVFPYIDNLAHAASSWREHIDTILAIIDECDKVNLRIKPGSIRVAQAMLKILGHILAPWGIGVDPQKAATVMNWPLPEDCANLRAFFGFAGFLADHIRHFADLRAPFDKLKAQDGKIVWTPLLISQFKAVQQAIAQAPWLKHPDPNKRFAIATDASDLAYGGVLYQPDDEDHTITPHNIVAIFSKKFNETQRRYPVYKKEGCAVIFSLLRFHSYIAMTYFTLITDHLPLKFLQEQHSLSASAMQWIDILSRYNFTIVHRPGIMHIVPDALSRLFSLTYKDGAAWGTQPNIKYQQVANYELTASDKLCADSIQKERQACEKRFERLNTLRTRQRKAMQRKSNQPSAAHITTSSSTHMGGGTEPGNLFASSPMTLFHMHVEDESLWDSEQEQEFDRLSTDFTREFELADQEQSDLLFEYENGIEYSPFVEAHHLLVQALAAPPPEVPLRDDDHFTTVYDLEAHELLNVSTVDLQVFNDVISSDQSVQSAAIDSFMVSALSHLMHSTSSSSVSAVSTRSSSQLPRAASPSSTITPSVSPSVNPPSVTEPSSEPSAPSPSVSTSPPVPPKLTLQDERTLIAAAKRGMIVPPPHERQPLIDTAHAFGHLGTKALQQQLFAKGFWWPGMRHDISSTVNGCDECLRYNIGKTGYHPLRSVTASFPGDHLQMDVAHLPRSRDNYTDLIVFIDVFTGFVILRPILHESSESIARALLDVISLIGPPRILQSDRGKPFVSAVLDTLTRLTGFDRRIASAYHPQTDGKVERAISSTKSIICKMLQGSFDHWPLFLPFVQMTFNNRISRITGSSPHVLFFGRPMNEFRDYSTDEAPVVDLENWKEHQRKLLSIVYPSIALRASNMTKKRQEEFARLRAHTLMPNLPVGTVVTLKDTAFLKGRIRPTHVAKYDGKRYTIVRQTINGAYVLQDSDGNILDRRVPIDQIKLVRAWRESSDSKGDVYEVEKITDHRLDTDENQMYYLIKWKGYSKPTWEPYANITDKRMITNYMKHLNRAADKKLSE